MTVWDNLQDPLCVFCAYFYHLLLKREEPPNPLKQGSFAALRSPKILSFLKMCTLPERRKRPALRGFVGERCALGCTSLYHSAIFERAHPGENAPKRRTFFCIGIHALPAPVKAHTAPHVWTQAWLECVLIGSVHLCHEFFNALLFTRNVRSIELLLIELLDDQLYRQDSIEQTPVLYSTVLRDDRSAFCKDEPATLKLLHILAHSVAAHPDCVADSGIACMTLISFTVLYVKQITVDGNRSSRQPKLIDYIRQRKIILCFESLSVRLARRWSLHFPKRGVPLNCCSSLAASFFRVHHSLRFRLCHAPYPFLPCGLA